MPTQQQIAEHLEMDQAAVSRHMAGLGIDWTASSMDAIRSAYIKHLRGQAAGHTTNDGDNLVKERVLTERVDRELKQMQVAEKRGTLVNVAQLESEISNMVGAFRAELLARDDNLKDELDALYGIEVDLTILNEHTFAALGQLGRYDPVSSGFAAPPGGDAGAAGAPDHDGVGEEIPAAVV